MEAVNLSLLGRIIGIIIGLLRSWLLSIIAEWPTVVSQISIIMSYGFSKLVGIFFGYYPAYKASPLNPIDAVRFEF